MMYARFHLVVGVFTNGFGPPKQIYPSLSLQSATTTFPINHEFILFN